MGEGWQGLGSGHEELSPAACLLGGRTEAFSTALVDPITMDLHEHSCAVSRNFLSGKVCFSCPASVFACACQINNISCWVIGNKCKNFWVYDANPYGIISSQLYKDFSDHRIWHGYTAKPVGWQRELGVQPLQDPAWSRAGDGKLLGLVPCPHSSPQAWRSSYGLLSCTKLTGGEGCAAEGYQSCVEMETQGVEIVWSSRAPQEGQHWSCCAAQPTLTADIWTKVRCVPRQFLRIAVMVERSLLPGRAVSTALEETTANPPSCLQRCEVDLHQKHHDCDGSAFSLSLLPKKPLKICSKVNINLRVSMSQLVALNTRVQA